MSCALSRQGTTQIYHYRKVEHGQHVCLNAHHQHVSAAPATSARLAPIVVKSKMDRTTLLNAANTLLDAVSTLCCVVKGVLMMDSNQNMPKYR